MGDSDMRRLLKWAGGLFALAVVVVVGGSLLFASNCAGSMQACYASWRQFSNGESPESQARWAVISQFSASTTSIAFSVILDNGETALLFVDRNTGQQRIIYEEGFGFWAPHLSSDGERLVAIRRRQNTAQREILTCQIASWRCDILLRTEDNLRSPVEIDKNTILYSSSPLRIGRDGRHLYIDYDLQLLRKDSPKIQLSDFQLHELHSISVAKDKIYFSAIGPKRNKSVFPGLYSKKVTEDRSEIYAIEFDAERQQIRAPTETLDPLFVIGGSSIGVGISPDGRVAAVRNTQYGRQRYVYEIVLVSVDGGAQQRLKTEAIIASPAIFIKDTVVFNELFADRYEVKLFDLNRKSISNIVEINHSSDVLRKLNRIDLAVGN